MSHTASELAFLTRAMKAPRIAACAESMAKRAETEGWDHQTYLAAVLAEEVGAREAHAGQHRVKAARFPQVKTLDDFDFGFQRSVKQQMISHLAQLDFLHEVHNVVFLGPPGTGKTHLSIALGVQAARRGHRVVPPSPPPRTGWAASPAPNGPANWKKNSSGSAGSHSSSSTKSATSPSTPTPPPCSSR